MDKATSRLGAQKVSATSKPTIGIYLHIRGQSLFF
jgi:hypothetical protein